MFENPFKMYNYPQPTTSASDDRQTVYTNVATVPEPSDYDTYVEVADILNSFVMTLHQINTSRLGNIRVQEEPLQKVEQVIIKYINQIHKDVFNDD